MKTFKEIMQLDLKAIDQECAILRKKIVEARFKVQFGDSSSLSKGKVMRKAIARMLTAKKQKISNGA